MDKYIEKLYNQLVPENKGYIYVRTENIFFPIFKVSLSITKRRHIALNLIEEMILKIVNGNVSNVDEIAGILGLERSLLDITISDLFVKDLIYQSCGVCTLTGSGREAIQELETIKKEKDTLDNLYINPFNGEISNTSEDEYIKNCYEDERKVNITFNCDDISFYISNLSKIKEIFNSQTAIYSFKGNQVPDELLSIDSVENYMVHFIKIPVHIYVSETGNDMDLVSGIRKLNKFLDTTKNEVIRQIRESNLLKNIFVNRFKKEYILPGDFCIGSRNLEEEIRDFVKSKNKDDMRQYTAIKNTIIESRTLLDNEIYIFYELMLNKSKCIEFYVENLDFWSKESSFLTMLSMIDKKADFNIMYKSVGSFERSEKRIKASIPGLNRNTIKASEHGNWLKICFDNKFEIICIPYYIEVFNNSQLIKKIYYYKSC